MGLQSRGMAEVANRQIEYDKAKVTEAEKHLVVMGCGSFPSNRRFKIQDGS